MSRLPAAVALEARVEWRYGIVAAAGALALLWTLVLLAVPAEGARVLAPYLLFLDTAGFGALLVVALLLFERGEGTRAALTATPLRTGESVAARLIVLVALSLAIAAPMPAAALRGRLDEVARALAPVLLGVAVTSLLLLTLCLAIGARARTLQGFLLAMPPALVPLIAVPMLHASGVVEHPVMYAVPTTVGADLIRLGVRPGSVEAGPALVALGLGYALLWIAAGAVAAHRAIESGAAAAPRPGRARVRALPGPAALRPRSGGAPPDRVPRRGPARCRRSCGSPASTCSASAATRCSSSSCSPRRCWRSRSGSAIRPPSSTCAPPTGSTWPRTRRRPSPRSSCCTCR